MIYSHDMYMMLDYYDNIISNIPYNINLIYIYMYDV